jgi:NAD(P)-dependent dehydrogenase (short-subunit alcohol dehydrogenase family)
MKKAIIIGATSGIGKSLAELLLREGYEVGVTG